MLPAYHPAPIRTLASGERVMVPSLLTDLVALDGEMQWGVTGNQPRWMAHVDAEADRFAAFEVELVASTVPQAQRACLRYGLPQASMETNPPVCVDWLADGQPHVVRMSVRGQPGWTRRITHLQLLPFGAGPVPAGVDVRTRNPRLVPPGMVR